MRLHQQPPDLLADPGTDPVKELFRHVVVTLLTNWGGGAQERDKLSQVKTDLFVYLFGQCCDSVYLLKPDGALSATHHHKPVMDSDVGEENNQEDIVVDRFINVSEVIRENVWLGYFYGIYQDSFRAKK